MFASSSSLLVAVALVAAWAFFAVPSSAAVTSVTLSVCQDLNTTLDDDTDKTAAEINRDTATMAFVNLGSAVNFGVCGSLNPLQKTCCEAEAEALRLPLLISNYAEGWQNAFAGLANSFDFTTPSEFFQQANKEDGTSTTASSSSGSGSGFWSDDALYGFFDDYFNARENGDSVAVAKLTFKNAITDYLAEYVAQMYAEKYCDLANVAGPSCACEGATWLEGTKSYPPVVSMSNQISNYFGNIAEAIYQIIKAFIALKEVATLASQYTPGDNCGKMLLATYECQYCYGFDASLLPCHQLCIGGYKVCFGEFSKMIAPKWKSAVNGIYTALRNIQYYTQNFEVNGDDEGCPTCTNLAALATAAANTCPAGGISLANANVCQNGEATACQGQSNRRSAEDSFGLTADFAEPYLSRVRINNIDFQVRQLSRRIVATTTTTTTPVEDLSDLQNLANLFYNIGPAICEDRDDFATPGAVAGSGSGQCWPGNIDLLNAGNSGSTLKSEFKNKATQLKQQAAGSSNTQEQQNLEEQSQNCNQIVNAMTFQTSSNPEDNNDYTPDMTQDQIQSDWGSFGTFQTSLTNLDNSATEASSLSSSASYMTSSLVLLLLSLAFVAFLS